MYMSLFSVVTMAVNSEHVTTTTTSTTTTTTPTTATTTTTTTIPNGAEFVQFSFQSVSTVLLTKLILLSFDYSI